MKHSLASELPVSEWRGGISLFPSAYTTVPDAMRERVPAGDFASYIMPEHPRLCAVKERAPYFLPTALREAPLTGKTRAQAQAKGEPLVGVMRSARHVIAGRALKLDLDGVTKHGLVAITGKLRDAGCAFLLYSTYSQGLKPGIRARLVIFLDEPLATGAYQLASRGASKLLLGTSLDPSEGYLYQLAGTYVAHSDRSRSAFRIAYLRGSCCSSRVLIATAIEEGRAQAPCAVQIVPAVTGRRLTSFDVARVEHALGWIDANSTLHWMKVGMMLKAMNIGDEGIRLWVEFSMRAGAGARVRNTESRYDLAAMWDNFAPGVSAEIAMATVFAMARDNAAGVLRQGLRESDASDLCLRAASYLGHRHRALGDQIIREHEARRTPRAGEARLPLLPSRD